MGFLDRLFGSGRDRDQRQQQPTGGWEPPTLPQQGGQGYADPRGQRVPPASQDGTMPTVGQAVAAEDERAIARYRYLLRTAPPEQIEQVHAEAFGRLTPQQRQQVLDELGQTLPPGEAPRSDAPQDLARAATRAEMREPGSLGRAFAGPGVGSTMAGSMMGTIAGVVIGSALANSLLGGYEGSPEAGEVGEQSGDLGDQGDLGGGDGGGMEDAGGLDGGYDGGGDFGGGFDGGGDFGGADFGGFDF